MLNLPKEFKNKYQKLLGEADAEVFFKSLNSESKKAFRINTLKNTQSFSKQNLSKVPVIENAFYGTTSGQDPEWTSGLTYSQDPSAMFPAEVLHVEPGDKVLDLCAAPGGKTTRLAEKLANQGILVANEISSSRVKSLRENMERWGAGNVLITNNDSASLTQTFPEYFNKILVDAPCSGEGMFRKNPEAINYWSQDYVLTCQTRQKEILTEAVKMLTPGGELVYSTCTFSPEEDEEIVSWLVNDFNFEILPVDNIETQHLSHGKDEWGNCKHLDRTLRFWPQDNIGEGQYLARLRKLSTTKTSIDHNKKSKRHKKQKRDKLSLSKEQFQLVGDLLEKFNLPSDLLDWQSKVKVRKDHVFIPVIAPNELKGLKVISNGIELGVLKKNRFEPGHQLAEILAKTDQARVVDLANNDEYLSYLHGETVNVKSDLQGFVLVSYHKLIFSFGKVTGNGVLKNFYPKGLRI